MLMYNLKKFIFTLVVVIVPVILAHEASKDFTLFYQGMGVEAPGELFCLDAFDRCEQEFNAIMSLIPKTGLTLKEQLIQTRVTTLYTKVRSLAIQHATNRDINKACILLTGLYVKLHEYANPADWDRLMSQASPILANL